MVNVGKVDVEGSIHNANGETVHGYLILTVLENGQELTQERFGPITILGQSEQDYRYTISYPGIHDGPSYEVKATWVSE